MKAKLIIITLLLVKETFAQTSSLSIQDYNQPYPRHLEWVAYDTERKKLILFGGNEFRDGKIFSPEYTSEWDGIKWKTINTTGPAGRSDPQLIYDKDKKIAYLIGGRSGSRFLKDVWTWNGQQWLLIDTLCPLQTVNAVYDPTDKRILLYGDVQSKDNQLKYELWEFKEGIWKKLSAEGPKIVPMSILYHEKRKSLFILDWEKDIPVIWEWENERWHKKTTTAGPRSRIRYALFYSQDDAAVYLFGGTTPITFQLVGDFWKWDGNKWKKIETGNNPSARSAAIAVPAEKSILLYGGSYKSGNSNELTNELWEWKNKKWKLINALYASGLTRKLDSLKQLITDYPGDTNTLLKYGIALKNADQISSAEKVYKKLLALQPGNMDAMTDLVIILDAQGKSTERENYYSKALASGLMTAAHYSKLGSLSYETHKYEESIILYEKAIELGIEDRGMSFFNLGCAYIKTGNKDKAFEALNKSIGKGYLSRHRLVNDVRLESIRTDARYADLLEKIK